ncbi:dipeptide transporter ATP-binding subunit [compost metagenome]
MSAVPVPNPGQKKQRIVLTGDVPNPETPPTGCAFHPRCPYAMDRCKSEAPELRTLDTGHQVSCHLY